MNRSIKALQDKLSMVEKVNPLDDFKLTHNFRIPEYFYAQVQLQPCPLTTLNETDSTQQSNPHGDSEYPTGYEFMFTNASRLHNYLVQFCYDHSLSDSKQFKSKLNAPNLTVYFYYINKTQQLNTVHLYISSKIIKILHYQEYFVIFTKNDLQVFQLKMVKEVKSTLQLDPILIPKYNLEFVQRITVSEFNVSNSNVRMTKEEKDVIEKNYNSNLMKYTIENNNMAQINVYREEELKVVLLLLNNEGKYLKIVKLKTTLELKFIDFMIQKDTKFIKTKDVIPVDEKQRFYFIMQSETKENFYFSTSIFNKLSKPIALCKIVDYNFYFLDLYSKNQYLYLGTNQGILNVYIIYKEEKMCAFAYSVDLKETRNKLDTIYYQNRTENQNINEIEYFSKIMMVNKQLIVFSNIYLYRIETVNLKFTYSKLNSILADSIIETEDSEKNGSKETERNSNIPKIPINKSISFTNRKEWFYGLYNRNQITFISGTYDSIDIPKEIIGEPLDLYTMFSKIPWFMVIIFIVIGFTIYKAKYSGQPQTNDLESKLKKYNIDANKLYKNIETNNKNNLNSNRSRNNANLGVNPNMNVGMNKNKYLGKLDNLNNLGANRDRETRYNEDVYEKMD